MIKSFITLAHGGNLKYDNNLPSNVNLENVGISVNYSIILITLAPRDDPTNIF